MSTSRSIDLLAAQTVRDTVDSVLEAACDLLEVPLELADGQVQTGSRIVITLERIVEST